MTVMKNMTIWVMGCLTISGFILTNLIFWKYKDKTAYVNNVIVFSDFKGTIELKAKMERAALTRKNELDSLFLDLRLMEQEIASGTGGKTDAGEYLRKREFADKLAREFRERAESEETEYTEQVWTQINSYLLEYGKREGYDYIYGAAGNGSMMYGNEDKKYNGGSNRVHK